MTALKIEKTLSKIEKNMAEFAPYRRAALFSQFLVNGYTAITLSSVPKEKFSELLRAKLCLGTLITLYDDFADRPTQQDPQLLDFLYQLNFQSYDSVRILNPRCCDIIDFSKSLFAEVDSILKQQPHYCELTEILNFDMKQFYSANQFSSLLMTHPYFNSRIENRLYGHHNMGMVMVAMMDLMAVEEIDFAEFGAMREVFLMGQRIGRISNVLTTRKRELLDGDLTGELSVCKNEREVEVAMRRLGQEVRDLRDKIGDFDRSITTFSVKAYLDGLRIVQDLHDKMKGVI